MGPLVAALAAGAAQGLTTPRPAPQFQPPQMGGGGMRGTVFQRPQGSVWGSLVGPLMEAFLKQKEKDLPQQQTPTPAQTRTVMTMTPWMWGAGR
jgi:hypothetical protein